MRLTVHQGARQVGGSITEIRTAKTRLIIDMGATLPSAVGQSGSPKIQGVTVGERDCDAILVTHYHGDHAGEYQSVLEGIPIYMGAIAKEIFWVVQRTLKNKLDKGDPDIVNRFVPFAPNVPIQFADIKVTPYSVDHSAFDAYAFLIEAEGKRILHTGDFRMHGAKGRKMPQMYAKYCSNIDVLITEGTMLSRMGEKVMTEHELGQRAVEYLKAHKNVFVLCSSTNIDSIAEFYNAATRCGKPFIICEDDFQGEILRIVTRNSRSPFYNFGKRKVYTYSAKNQKLHDYMRDCGFCFLGRTNAKTQSAMQAFEDNALIYSMWEGYLNPQHPAYDEYKATWINNAIERGSKKIVLHTSGHATAEDIKLLIATTNAQTIVPIHGENPQAFHSLTDKARIVMPKDGQTIEI